MTPEDCLAFLSERLPPDCALPVIGLPGDPYTADRRRWGAHVWRRGRLNRQLNLFVGISAFNCPASAVEGAFIARRKAEFVCTVAIMIDDIGTKVPVESVRLEPTWWVETSPGNFQGWYVLEQPCMDADRVTGFIDALIRAGLCLKDDPGMSGVSRVGRLPGGINGKAKYGPDGFNVRMYRAERRRYTLEEIAFAYGIPATSPPRTRLAVVLPDGLTGATPMAEVILRLLEAEGRIMGRPDGSGWWPILCPWVDGHTDGCETGTAYIQPGEQNGWLGGFKCHHGHCAEYHIGHLLAWGEDTISARYAPQQKDADHG